MGLIRNKIDIINQQIKELAEQRQKLIDACAHTNNRAEFDYIGECTYVCNECDAKSYQQDFQSVW